MIASRLSVRRGFTVVMKSGALSLPVATSQRNLLTHLASSSLATAWKIISCLISEFSPFSVCLFCLVRARTAAVPIFARPRAARVVPRLALALVTDMVGIARERAVVPRVIVPRVPVAAGMATRNKDVKTIGFIAVYVTLD